MDVNMNGNAELLNYVYQNSQMGIDTTKQLLEITENQEFRKVLEDQTKEYKNINKKVRDALNKNGYDEKGIGELAKVSSYLMINMKTLMDKSASHIADMLIKGSNMGIVEGTKKINEYENEVEKDVIQLMKDLMSIEQKNIDQLKGFL